MTAVLHLSGELDLVHRDKDGNVVEQRAVAAEAAAAPPISEAVKVTERYVFVDWPGPESVLDASATYLADLRDFVEEGIDGGFISG